MWAFETYDIEWLGAQWTYLKTRGKAKGIPIRTAVDRAHVEAGMKSIVETGQEILRVLSNTTHANSLPANLAACSNFGGCPYGKMGICNVDRGQRLKQLLGKQTATATGKGTGKMASLEEMLEKRKTGRTNSKGQKPPASTADLAVVEGGRSVNSPEASKDPEVQRVVSEGIGAGATGGSRASNDENAQRIAVAGATAASPEDAKAGVDSELERIAKEEKARTNPTQKDILAWVVTGQHNRFNSKSKEGTPEMPYCHGRSLTSMKKNGLVNFRKDGDIYNVMPTDDGRAAYVKANPDAQAALPPAPAPTPTPSPAPAPAPASAPDATPEPEATGEVMSNREVWIEIASIAQGDVKKTEALYEAFAKRFG
jgi:hypothetical protein